MRMYIVGTGCEDVRKGTIRLLRLQVQASSLLTFKKFIGFILEEKKGTNKYLKKLLIKDLELNADDCIFLHLRFLFTSTMSSLPAKS